MVRIRNRELAGWVQVWTVPSGSLHSFYRAIGVIPQGGGGSGIPAKRPPGHADANQAFPGNYADGERSQAPARPSPENSAR